MSADKNVRFMRIDKSSCGSVIPSRITADMSHQHLHSLTLENPVYGMDITQIVIVAVARNSHQRLECRNLLRQFHATTEITGMPYLVYRFKKITELLREHPVRV